MSNSVSIGGLPAISETDLFDIRGGTGGVRVRSNDDSIATLTLDNTGALTIPGALVAASVAGSAASLTAIPAANLTGTLPNATFPATLPVASAVNLTSVTAANLTGTVPNASLPTTLPSVTSVGGAASGVTVAAGSPVKGCTKYSPTFSPATVPANTTAEETFTVTGVTITDVIIACNKPTAQAGLGIVGVRQAGANIVGITFSNNTAAAIIPTAAQTYTIVALTF